MIPVGEFTTLSSELMPQTVEMPIHVYTAIVEALAKSDHYTADSVLRILKAEDGLD